MRLFLAAVAAGGLLSSAAFAQSDGHYYRHARHHKATVITADAVPGNAEAAVPQSPCHNVHWTTWDGIQNFTACGPE
jgi:fatty acid desaturase